MTRVSNRESKIYFHHFHKCAGSAAVRLLNKQGRKLAADAVNGNMKLNGFTVSLHTISDTDLTRLALDPSIDTIIYEWGLPNLKLLKRLGFVTTTIIRNPVERMLSNYIYDRSIGVFKGSILEYLNNIAIPYNRADYYNYEISNRLNNHGSESQPRENLEYLKSNFDAIYIMEHGQFSYIGDTEFDHLELANMKKENKSTGGLSEIIRKRQRNIARETLHSVLSLFANDLEVFEGLKANARPI